MRTNWIQAAGLGALICLVAAPIGNAATIGEGKEKKKDFPDFKKISEGYEQVVSTLDGEKSLYTLWKRDKDGQMLAELPSGYSSQKHYIALTLPTGSMFSGLQSGALYAYWKRFDKKLALIAPNLSVRSSGDQASKDSIKNHFVDRVVAEVPIVCMGPGGQPVIDLDNFLIAKGSIFYRELSGAKKNLTKITKAKAFPENIELAFEVPDRSGDIKTFRYSISNVPKSTGYKPRKADDRIGYFTTYYRDLGKFKDGEVWNRYINRWHLEKADPNLKMSPPKTPLVYYIEHTVPVRYRRFVKQGVLYWNKAFEQVGLVDAIEVYYQDKTTGAHMDKDPEDVRFNFIRWLSNDIGTAIGPSRAHPETGQILDADIVLTDGWIRHFYYQANDYLPAATAHHALENFDAETMAWLDEHPEWDPRVQLATPVEQRRILRERALERGMGLVDAAKYMNADFMQASMAGDPVLQDLVRTLSGTHGAHGDAELCFASHGKASDMALTGLHMMISGLLDDDKEDGDKDDDEEDVPKIDGIPEWFVGPMLADLTCHEAGHTLGLRHNFKASSVYSLEEINSEEVAGKKPFAGSVMDYIPVNINLGEGPIQGDYQMIGCGPYDMWAIEYGYTLDKPEEVLSKIEDPMLTFATDYDTTGPDPLARRYDFAKNPLNYAKNRLKLATYHRERILEHFVKDGESWGRARRGYEITLGTQAGALSVVSNWLGGAFINKDHKGDPGDRKPIVPVSAAMQREALQLCIDHAFHDEAFGLTSELLGYMSQEKWSDPGSQGSAYSDATWAVHDRIAGVQRSVLTQVLNPTTLRRVYDSEFLIPEDQDALTLPEVIDKVSDAIWDELTHTTTGKFSARQPMISSLRRNLQRVHLERFIDLSMGESSGVAGKTVATLATAKLRQIHKQLEGALDADGGMDAYTKAHLGECSLRIEKALDAQYIYNTDDMGGGGGPIFFSFGRDKDERD